MNRLKRWMEKTLMTVWPGILLVIMNCLCFFMSYKIGAGDSLVLINIFGIVFSMRNVYDHFRWKRIQDKNLKEFDEIMKIVKPEMDVMFEELMKDYSTEKYRRFIIEGNILIEREARRRSHLRVSKSDRL